MVDYTKLHKFIEVLSDNTRLSIIDSLENGSKSVRNICTDLNMEQSRVSHSLAKLRCCGFVNCEQIGKERHYFVDKEVLKLIQNIYKHMNKHATCYNLRGE
jgi:DNA-binding transcriptional ArsR family regulator